MGGTGSFALGVGYVTAVMLTDMVCFGVLALSVSMVSVIVRLLHRAGVIRLLVELLHSDLHLYSAWVVYTSHYIRIYTSHGLYTPSVFLA